MTNSKRPNWRPVADKAAETIDPRRRRGSRDAPDSSASATPDIGHESTIRRSEGERYTKKIHLPILQRLVNSIRINAELSHLSYAGAVGVAAPNRDRELTRFVVLAEREMKKKEKPANK
jgi:hypothetical protein